MRFNSMMHISFFTSQMEMIRDFYENKQGATPKIVTRVKAYGKTDHTTYGKLAETDPEKVIIVYLQIAPGQFIELFPDVLRQGKHTKWNENARLMNYFGRFKLLAMRRDWIVCKEG